MPENEIADVGWEKEADEIVASYSSLGKHRTCAQAFYYRYELGLRQPEYAPSPYAHFGSWWGTVTHAEALVRGRKLESLIFPPRKFTTVDNGPEWDQQEVTVQKVFTSSVEWWNGQSVQYKDVFLEKIGEDLPHRLLKTYESWRGRWSDDRKHEHPLGMEVFWKRALPRPEKDKEWEFGAEREVFGQLPQISILGYIDQIYYDDERDMVVVRDDKAPASLGSQTVADDMMDSQLQLYAWGVTPKLFELGSKAPRAVEYDRVKSVRPPKPKVINSGGLSTTSKNWDLRTYLDWTQEDTRPQEAKDRADALRAVPQDTWEDGDAAFLDRLGQPGQYFPGATKDGSKAGIYQIEQQVIDRITTPAHMSLFQQRSIVPISRHIVRAHLRGAIDTATDIWRTKKRTAITHEAPRNLSKANCGYCDFKMLCQGQMIAGPEGVFDLREFGLASKHGNMLVDGKVIQDDTQAAFATMDDLP